MTGIDDRSPTAKALSKVSQITSISLMMVIPAMIGYGVDQYAGTVILFTALGLVAGVAGAIKQLIDFVAHQDDEFEMSRRSGTGEVTSPENAEQDSSVQSDSLNPTSKTTKTDDRQN